MKAEINKSLIEVNTLKELIEFSNNLFIDSEYNFYDWKNYKDFLLDQKSYILEIINKSTIEELNKYTYKGKKSEMVDKIYDLILMKINLADSFQYSPMEESFNETFRKTLNKYSEADFIKYKEKKLKESLSQLKALENPETLEEFKTFIMIKGERKLNKEQLARYDELIADLNKKNQIKQQERKINIDKVDNVNCNMILKESCHTKKKIPLFVVTLSERVERSVYEQLNNRAKKLNGYYSSYNKEGAIPGFTFQKKEEAELFLQVKNKDIDNFRLKEQEKEEKQKAICEELKEKGRKQIEEGEEELYRERKDNTCRRAQIASNVENRASEKIVFGKKLIKIAEAMESGKIKYLDKLRNASELETLNNILIIAKYKHIKEEKLSYRNHENYEISEQTIFYVKMPYPKLSHYIKNDLIKMIEQSDGKKLAARRILKRFIKDKNGIEWVYFNNPFLLEDYETLFCSPCAVISEWMSKRYKEKLMHLKRVQKIGIENIYMLRAALRELIKLVNELNINEDQSKKLKIRQLEREFVEKKIAGFFPTPEELAEKKIELLKLENRDTILEPSAGLGHLADRIKEKGFSITCIEVHSGLCDVLREKGHIVINEDFLNHYENYDKIIMNPPFENSQDIHHVKHAFNLLKSGGRLVATMANNKAKNSDFLEWVNLNGYYEKNPEKSFINAFNSTGVSTITVVLDKE